jgi:transposase
MDYILKPVTADIFNTLTKEQLRILFAGEQEIRLQLEAKNRRLAETIGLLEEQRIEINGKFIKLKKLLFGRSSEQRPQNGNEDSNEQDPEKKPPSKPKNRPRPGKRQTKLPSERYPNIPVTEINITLEDLPSCTSCQHPMEATSMVATHEELTVTPRKYHITRYNRAKYRCGCCYSSLVTAPGLPRILPGSAYSDEMIIDVSLAKYLDLIPMERYAAMAARQGVVGIPANSMINLTHHLAEFLKVIWLRLKDEFCQAKVARCDESPHNMLEGDKRKNWYLWEFAAEGVVYFEYHDTRSGDVALNVLQQANAVALLTDDFGGYHKAVRTINESRIQQGEAELIHALCNAHSRRKFIEAEQVERDAKFYLDHYGKIYQIEAEARTLTGPDKLAARAQASLYFEAMLTQAQNHQAKYPQKGLMTKAINYFRSNYPQLTQYLTLDILSIDNNATERSLRAPAVGRKTWYGTHSRKASETAAIMFSIVESCKVNNVNPRQYIPAIVDRIHYKKPWMTPREYKAQQDSS